MPGPAVSYDPVRGEVVLPRDWSLWPAALKHVWPSKQCRTCGFTGFPADLRCNTAYKFSEEMRISPRGLRTKEASRCIRCIILTKLLSDWDAYDIASEDIRIRVGFTDDGWIVLTINEKLPTQRRKAVEVFIPHSSGLEPAGFQRKRLIPMDTSSQQSLNWAREKVRHCLTRHQKCSAGATHALPTRLIAVTSHTHPGDVVLQESKDLAPGSKYVALSYCWGNIRPHCLTTRLTYNDAKVRIAWASLPRTFQDAVVATRMLGIEYLWMDSVCIIQGDEADWLAEAPRMLDVYRSAVVTLAAVDSADSAGGLFKQSQDRVQSKLFTLRQGDKATDLFARPLGRAREMPGGKLEVLPADMDPLFKRAWAFQERLISRRILYFNSDEIKFECLAETACECEHINDGTWESTTHHRSSYHNALQQPFLLDKPYKLWSAWRGLVGAYSALGLTYETDKLVAIGAIAKTIHGKRPDETYLAGLWSGSLHIDLLWSVLSPMAGKRSGVAPSWSWASVRTEVVFVSLTSLPLMKPLSAVVSASCNLRDERNPFGQVTGGQVVLRGPVLELLYKADRRSGEQTLSHEALGLLATCRPRSPCYLRADYVLPAPASELVAQPVWLLGMVDDADKFNGKSRYYLVLIKSAGHDTMTFTRFGFLSDKNRPGESRKDESVLKGFFERHSEKQTVTII